MKISLPTPLFAASCALLVLIALPRFLYLDRFLTADEKRWQANVAGFTTKLSHGDLNQLLQQPHPGITTQWFAAATIPSDNWAIRKIPLVLWQCIIIIAIIYVASRLVGPWPALALGFALAVDPMLVAHTRIYAMDSLLAQFALLSLLALLLAEKTKEFRYLLFAGAAAAAAFLSKLPGILLLPVSLGYLAMINYRLPKSATKQIMWWLIGFTGAACLILPSFAIDPVATIGNFAEFFRSDDYTELHQASPFYYLSTLFFFTSPFQWLAVILTIYLLTTHNAFPKTNRRQVVLLWIFAILFILMMSAGSKKGDRYILPAIIMIDGFVLFTAAWLWPRIQRRHINIIASVAIVIFLWQTADVLRLTPYTLAYTNPLTKPWLGNRRLGWGEGLDLAAEYLNVKAQANTLKVAVNYPAEFNYRFTGQAVPLHQWETPDIDYVVIYRTSLQRGPDSWEQDVLNHFASKSPEKIIYLNRIPYAWIYKLKSL